MRLIVKVIIVTVALSVAALLASVYRFPLAPTYPSVPSTNAPTETDLLVIRAVLIHYATVGRALGLPGALPGGPPSSLSTTDILNRAGDMRVRIRPTTAPGSFQPEPSGLPPEQRDLIVRNAAYGPVSLRALRLPPYMSFTTVGQSDALRNPPSLGRLAFSLPGYAHDRAVIHVDVWPFVKDGLSGGSGVLVLLERQRGRWTVVGEERTWIS